jgi:peptidoglycan hydrolase-like protein with peptidoglycan-binding domain
MTPLHAWEMKRNSIVSLLIATLALGMQPAGAQSAARYEYLATVASSNANAKATIRAVQVALQKKGYSVDKADGKYTFDTRAAVNRFQRDNGLRETGTITQPVLKALGLS